MSDNARDLLIYGIAAAKANSRDEARNYLEWVLATDSDFDQQAEAWYWLSVITDDPAEKRSCLENVLAGVPRHPEARRDIAILDGRLDAGQMHDPRFAVQPLTPHANLSPEEMLRYKCERCGATLTADRITGTLLCGFCGYRPGDSTSLSVEKGGTSVVDEQDWVAAIYSRKGHRWQVPTARTFQCGSCGASVMVPAGGASTSCPFCATPHVVQAADDRELIEPTGLLPFRLGAGEAFAAIVGWLKSEHFAPGNLGSRSTQSVARPVYLPFWTFDIEGEVRWSGYEVSTEFGRPARVQVSGSVPLLCDDILVAGTRSIPAELLGKLKFGTGSLLPYHADMLASWPAEIYAIAPAEASIEARSKALQGIHARSLISTSVGMSGTVEDIAIHSADLAVLSYKLALLPVWVSSYTFEGNTYQVVVNGNTGEVEGNVPRNALQRALNHLLGE